MKSVSRPLFIIIIICFTLPFMTFSCHNNDKTDTWTHNGLQLLLGDSGDENPTKPYPPVIAVFVFALIGLLTFFTTMLLSRPDLETTILRTPGLLAQEVGSDSISNLYNLKIVNKTYEQIPVDLKLLSHQGEIRMIKKKNLVPGGELMENVFFVVLDKNNLKQMNESITIGVYSDENKIEEIELNFVSKN